MATPQKAIEATKKWKKAHAERVREVTRAWVKNHPDRPEKYNLKSRYGITDEKIKERLLKQNNACAICGTKNFRNRKPYVDHDHSCCPGRKSCGKCVRGLLCINCNASLGWFEKNEIAIKEYKEKYIDGMAGR